MCGRFVSSTPVAELAERFLAAEVAVAERAPRYNVAPSDEVLAVASSRRARRLGTLSWGLVPHWAAGPAARKRLVNLRSETLSSRSGFRQLLERRRCIVPADGFYEWRKAPGGGAKQAFLVRAPDRAPLALAGLWDLWADPADPGSDRLRTCAVLTTAPNELVAAVHDRMPAILPEAAWDDWLDPSLDDAGHLAALLRPYDAGPLELVPVGSAVNSVRNDGPHLTEPVEPAGVPTLPSLGRTPRP